MRDNQIIRVDTYENEINPEDFRYATDQAIKAVAAFNEFGRLLAEVLKPLLDAFIDFGKFIEGEQDRKKQKYLTRYYRRGERMRKAGKL